MATLNALHHQHRHAVTALRSALAHQRLHHAYLFVGREATGTAALAQALIQQILCQSLPPNDPTAPPCNACVACRKWAHDNHPDVLRLAPDAEKGQITLERVRQTLETLALKPGEAARRVLWIESAHVLAENAQNTLLKSLEEPPGQALFILTAPHTQALLSTIRSRCQILRAAPEALSASEKQLTDAGIEPLLAQVVARLHGPDITVAERWRDAGFESVWDQLQRVFGQKLARGEAVQRAGALGSDKAQATMALTLSEVFLRDQLAANHGTAADACLSEVKDLRPLERLYEAARCLATLRAQQAMHLNRTRQLESLFLALHGERTSSVV